MDGALALAGPYAGSRARLRERDGGDRRRHLVGRRRRPSPTRSRSRGRPGAGTTAATPRSRSAGRGSRLSVRASASGGRAAVRRPPARAVARRFAPRGVWKRYGGTVALAGVDLRVAAGAVVGLVGPNGSGKTTLLHAVAGLVGIDGGVDRRRRVRQPARGRHGAAAVLVPDEPTGFDELTVDGARHARARALERRRRSGRPRLSADRGLRPRSAPRPAARDALARAPPAGERRRRPLARSAAHPRRRGDRHARSRGGRRPQRGRRGPRGPRLRHPARDAGPAFRRQRLPRGRAAPPGTVIDSGEPGALRARHEAASLEEAFLAALGDDGSSRKGQG